MDSFVLPMKPHIAILHTHTHTHTHTISGTIIIILRLMHLVIYHGVKQLTYQVKFTETVCIMSQQFQQ